MSFHPIPFRMKTQSLTPVLTCSFLIRVRDRTCSNLNCDLRNISTQVYRGFSQALHTVYTPTTIILLHFIPSVIMNLSCFYVVLILSRV
jgi:hypothetical protein